MEGKGNRRAGVNLSFPTCLSRLFSLKKKENNYLQGTSVHMWYSYIHTTVSPTRWMTIFFLFSRFPFWAWRMLVHKEMWLLLRSRRMDWSLYLHWMRTTLLRPHQKEGEKKEKCLKNKLLFRIYLCKETVFISKKYQLFVIDLQSIYCLFFVLHTAGMASFSSA